jgi:hypothetical protein
VQELENQNQGRVSSMYVMRQLTVENIPGCYPTYAYEFMPELTIQASISHLVSGIKAACCMVVRRSFLVADKLAVKLSGHHA